MSKKRYRIRWGRVAMLIAALAAVGIAIYYAVVGIVALFSWLISLIDGMIDSNRNEDRAPQVVSAYQQMDMTNGMTARIDSFMTLPTRLDKKNIAVEVYDLTTQQTTYFYQNRLSLVPASCMKIPTAIAALKMLGMNHKYKTTLSIKGTVRNDTLIGSLLLNAEADPVAETLLPLCEKLRAKGIRHVRGQVYVNLALKDRLLGHPSAKSWDIPYNRTPLLLKGSRFVNSHLLYTLRTAGVTFRKDNSVKPQGKYMVIGTMENTLQDAIIPMMRNSSNIRAEAVLFHLDMKHKLAYGQQKWNIQHASERFWRKMWQNDSVMTLQRYAFKDGSGLSPQNRLTASSLVYMLRYAYADKELRHYLINYALATPGGGRRGSMLSRLSQAEYRNRIFCKTGTMTTIGASSLAGYMQGSDGHWYAFAIINVDSPVAEARLFQDRLCKTIMSKKKRR